MSSRIRSTRQRDSTGPHPYEKILEKNANKVDLSCLRYQAAHFVQHHKAEGRYPMRLKVGTCTPHMAFWRRKCNQENGKSSQNKRNKTVWADLHAVEFGTTHRLEVVVWAEFENGVDPSQAYEDKDIEEMFKNERLEDAFCFCRSMVDVTMLALFYFLKYDGGERDTSKSLQGHQMDRTAIDVLFETLERQVAQLASVRSVTRGSNKRLKTRHTTGRSDRTTSGTGTNISSVGERSNSTRTRTTSASNTPTPLPASRVPVASMVPTNSVPTADGRNTLQPRRRYVNMDGTVSSSDDGPLRTSSRGQELTSNQPTARKRHATGPESTRTPSEVSVVQTESATATSTGPSQHTDEFGTNLSQDETAPRNLNSPSNTMSLAGDISRVGSQGPGSSEARPLSQNPRRTPSETPVTAINDDDTPQTHPQRFDADEVMMRQYAMRYCEIQNEIHKRKNALLLAQQEHTVASIQRDKAHRKWEDDNKALRKLEDSIETTTKKLEEIFPDASLSDDQDSDDDLEGPAARADEAASRRKEVQDIQDRLNRRLRAVQSRLERREAALQKAGEALDTTKRALEQAHTASEAIEEYDKKDSEIEFVVKRNDLLTFFSTLTQRLEQEREKNQRGSNGSSGIGDAVSQHEAD